METQQKKSILKNPSMFMSLKELITVNHPIQKSETILLRGHVQTYFGLFLVTKGDMATSQLFFLPSPTREMKKVSKSPTQILDISLNDSITTLGTHTATFVSQNFKNEVQFISTPCFLISPTFNHDAYRTYGDMVQSESNCLEI